jgi:hypothetical protein
VKLTVPAEERPRVGLWLLLLCFIIGNGALGAGFHGEEANPVAESMFVVVCVLWWIARGLLNPVRRWPAYLILAFWIATLTLVVAVAREHVYRSRFLVVSALAVGALIVLSVVSTDRVKH